MLGAHDALYLCSLSHLVRNYSSPVTPGSGIISLVLAPELHLLLIAFSKLPSPFMTKLSDYFDYKFDSQGNTYVETSLRGMSLLRLPATNKGTAFTLQERIELGLDGLLPPLVTDIDEQTDRLYSSYCKQPNDISKYQFLRAIQDRSEVLFYALLERHLEEMTPIVYTPTIGLAVQQFSSLYRTARGLTLSAHNIDRIENILQQYPLRDVRIIVVTDASAILGIGDQGMGGLSICIGKLALYTVGGGLCPFQTLPINLDVGTNREELLDDPHYLGIRQKRLQDADYFELVDKFVHAVKHNYSVGRLYQGCGV